MNREIKFRAWDNDDKVMRDWDNLLLHRYAKQGDSIFNDIDLEIMQFTGLHDVNGKEIYEGDILTYTDDVDLEPYEVVWCDQSAQWRTHCNESDNCSVFEMSEALVEYAPSDTVIGNIHENPDLLNNESEES